MEMLSTENLHDYINNTPEDLCEKTINHELAVEKSQKLTVECERMSLLSKRLTWR